MMIGTKLNFLRLMGLLICSFQSAARELDDPIQLLILEIKPSACMVSELGQRCVIEIQIENTDVISHSICLFKSQKSQSFWCGEIQGQSKLVLRDKVSKSELYSLTEEQHTLSQQSVTVGVYHPPNIRKRRRYGFGL